MQQTARITEIANRFYSAFAAKNAAEMESMYAKEIHVSDPVFTDLKGSAAGDMWKMLCSRSADLKVTHEIVGTSENKVFVKWIAYYTFVATGRKVVNRIHATLEFRDEKIVRHIDRFDFWSWSRQALGLPGLLLGWTPILKNKVRSQAAATLKKFQAG